MATLEEMANKGQEKIIAKASIMAANYEAAKAKMIDSYNATPFGPAVKNNYATAIKAANYHAPDSNKWYRNWIAAMSR